MRSWITLGLLCGLAGVAAGAENPLFVELTTRGVSSGGGPGIPLPAPTVPDGLSAADQGRAIGRVIDGRQTLDALTRKTVVAPLVLNVTSITSPAGAIESPCRVDLWFVVHADLDKISDAQFLKRQYDTAASGESKTNQPQLVELTDAELASRSIAPDEGQKFFAGQIVLFDRARLNAALQTRQTRSPESVLVAMRLDPRFDGDDRYPNGWEKLNRNDAGQTQTGPRQAYRGAGGYVKATRLIDAPGALLVEYHLVFAEPSGWFDGANLLRSKLPLVCQDGVRKLRRQLAAQ